MKLEGEGPQGNAPGGKDPITSADSSDDEVICMIGNPNTMLMESDREPLKNITEKEYKSGREPRFGKSNPEIMAVPFWSAMIAAQLDPYHAETVLMKSDKLPHYNNSHDFSKQASRKKSDHPRPTWTFAGRMGQTTTELPDGRLVFIGGEYEDFYDPDFHIYNDVCVYDKNSSTSVLYGYPRTAFPPTDFHTATLVKGTPNIYIIGCLGYGYQRRSGETPVYRLDTRDFSMHAVKTSGEKPGWIDHHNACLVEDGKAIRVWGEKDGAFGGSKVYVKDGEKRGKTVDFEGEYLLNLETGRWTKQS
ncbi:hypothetical protein PG984_007929 [Apiospora sp. TS-2023a]